MKVLFYLMDESFSPSLKGELLHPIVQISGHETRALISFY